MLKTTKTAVITSNSMIDGQPVVYMRAELTENGSVTKSSSIQNVDLYETNKTECRADLAAFDKLVYELEDQGTEKQEETE